MVDPTSHEVNFQESEKYRFRQRGLVAAVISGVVFCVVAVPGQMKVGFASSSFDHLILGVMFAGFEGLVFWIFSQKRK